MSIESKNKMLEVPESHISDKSSNINYEKGSENLWIISFTTILFFYYYFSIKLIIKIHYVINHFLNVFLPLWFVYYYFFPTVLFVTTGLPKNASNRTWLPPLEEEFIFLIPDSTLCCENPFSPTKNAFNAY